MVAKRDHEVLVKAKEPFLWIAAAAKAVGISQ
jgi:hypothetical protein